MSNNKVPSETSVPTSGTEPTVNQPSPTLIAASGAEPTDNPRSDTHEAAVGNEAASSEESWRTPSDPFEIEVVQMATKRPENDPDYIPIEQAMATRRRSKWKANRITARAQAEADTATSGPDPTDTSASGGGRAKKQRGERSRNQLPKETYYIAALNEDGKPVEPKHVMAKFSSVCRIMARLHEPLNVDEWKDVNPHIKNLMWEQLQKYLVYPPGSEVIGSRFALSTMAHRWRQWKSDMNTNYVQKNKSPFEKYGNIPPVEWDKFVAKMTTPEALARRKKMSELAKKNKYPHRLGSSGYDGHIIEKEKSGEFVARREHDELTAALGTAEYSGRIRGKSTRTSWKVGFQTEMKSYKKRDAYKAKLREEVTEQVTQQVTQQFYRLAAQHPQAFPGLVPQPEQTVQIPSSVGSVETTPYQVDLITGPTPCSLVVPIGRAGKTKEVGSGLAIPGRQFHNIPIPEDYARVQVGRVNADQMSLELDIPTPEGIELLGDAVNQFILWHRRDIILTGQATEDASIQKPITSQARKLIPQMVSTYKPKEMAEYEAIIVFKSFRGQGPPKPSSPEPQTEAQKSVLGHADKIQSWDSTEVPKVYEYGKPFLPYHVMLDLPWPMRLLHDWSQWVDAQRTGASIGYANLMRVCMTAHTMRINLDGSQLKDKTPEERQAYVDMLHKNKRVEVATYLGQAMLTHVNKRVLMVPYHLTDHYILFLVYPRDHLVVVLDPTHYEEQKFMKFLVLLNLGHDYYRRHGGFVKDQKRTKLLCYKQPPAQAYADITCARCSEYVGDIKLSLQI
uniref:Hydroxyproline-rich glycoprotein-like n=1 Tax=Oryza alta TaxID=52545 RepID=A0A1V1H117_9ORYZ|nr:hydroxyproline-rich glycoprotein -like [Oryza alta]BAX25060.1 hydroxyproline-rich glycoprotein -like [Oryza alta]